MTTGGISFVVPVHNGASCIRETLDAIFAQDDGRPMEVIVVEDRSTDASAGILRQLAAIRPLRIVEGDGRGAAAAINLGIQSAVHPIVCQVDQDVVLGPGWMRAVVAGFDGPDVGAVQGRYVTDPHASLFARIMSLDLEQRYDALEGGSTTHVCTGNAAYRVCALHAAGFFDERFGYGYDNDMSYRLQAAGYRLAFCPAARSLHRWREGLAGYLGQQYGFGYGRIELVVKHRDRARGDSVSPPMMMAHPLVMLAGVAALAGSAAMAASGGHDARLALFGVVAIGGLVVERAAAGVRAARRFGDPSALLFPVVHLARDAAWIAAIAAWAARQLIDRPQQPAHSMRARRAGSSAVAAQPLTPAKLVGLIPAHNERANLAAVVAELRTCVPDLDLIVVDDGSTDGTAALAPRLDVRWVRLPERLGVGSAMRAGLRYAAALGYDAAVRIDGDGQHCAADVRRVIGPLASGDADVVLGSRYATDGEPRAAMPLVKRTLSRLVSWLTRRPVTDPTSGFYAVGPRALRVLAEHHPTGYAETELQLFLSRNAFRVVEVAVTPRSRFGGRTSLTAFRLPSAAARVLLAMIIVPFRRTVAGLTRD